MLLAVSLRAVAEAPQDFDLHRESLQQASRSRSKRREAPIAATPTAQASQHRNRYRMGARPIEGCYTNNSEKVRNNRQKDPIEAARWLCDRIGITPESLGWGAHDAALLAEGTKIAQRLIARDDKAKAATNVGVAEAPPRCSGSWLLRLHIRSMHSAPFWRRRRRRLLIGSNARKLQCIPAPDPAGVGLVARERSA